MLFLQKLQNLHNTRQCVTVNKRRVLPLMFLPEWRSWKVQANRKCKWAWECGIQETKGDEFCDLGRKEVIIISSNAFPDGECSTPCLFLKDLSLQKVPLNWVMLKQNKERGKEQVSKSGLFHNWDFLIIRNNIRERHYIAQKHQSIWPLTFHINMWQ